MTRSTKMPTGKLITKDEAADRLDVSPRTIDRYIDSGRVPAYKVGPRLVKLREADVDSLAQRIERKRHE